MNVALPPFWMVVQYSIDYCPMLPSRHTLRLLFLIRPYTARMRMRIGMGTSIIHSLIDIITVKRKNNQIIVVIY